MRIKFVEISNFRKLKSTHLDLDKKTTILVGANNSGKTSAMVALRIFLLSPGRLALRDVTIANWTQIDLLGDEWETDTEPTVDLDPLLPSLDVWLDVPLGEIQHVVHILPTLDWSGGMLGVRLKYQLKDLDKLKTEYLAQRSAARDASTTGPNGETIKIAVWPRSLTDFLERRLRAHIELAAYPLDPTAVTTPGKNGLAKPQALPTSALAFDHPPFKNLIKIDEIAAQRDFADASDHESGEDKGEATTRRFKRRLSDQLRSYYDRHLDPSKTPSDKDFEALGAIQAAERSFDARLEAGFATAFEELEDLGYPGMSNPKLKISTLLRATDGLKHGSSVQYEVADPSGDGTRTLKLPEDYSGLGYQNLIAMVFMLMGFRDEWMRVEKAGLLEGTDVSHEIQPLHLVLVEEPEAHLHAQVQQVFINKAYDLLRKHCDLGSGDTYCTQLLVSTHSSHVAHEADFANLRYFRRRPAATKGETPTTTVANLSHIFGDGDDTKRFVKRYLKATHCDLFFADGVIFVEGQAERILVPHFIRHHFPELSRRYVTLLELGGIRSGVDALLALNPEDPATSFLNVLECVAEHRLFEIPAALRPFVVNDPAPAAGDAEQVSDAEEPEEEDLPAEASPASLEAWRAFLETPYNQTVPFAEYVSDRGPFGTHQGVKGLEFERVLVILDDSDARGFLFSYDKLFEAKPLSDTDRKHLAEATDGGITRTRRLLYVTCTRAEKSLALVAYTDDPDALITSALRNGWFVPEEIERL